MSKALSAFANRQDTTLDQDRIQGKFQSPGYGIQGALARVGSKAQSGGPHARPKGPKVALQRGEIAKMPQMCAKFANFFSKYFVDATWGAGVSNTNINTVLFQNATSPMENPMQP